MSSIIAGGDMGKVAERFKRIADEIILAGNIVLYIPNIHSLFKQMGGGDEGITPMEVFLPLIKNDSIPVIGETYPQEFRKSIQEHSDFQEQFEKIQIEEMSKEEAVRLLTYQALIFENQFKTIITLDAIRKSVSLAYKYLHQKPLPLGAIDLLKQSLARAQQEGLEILKTETVISVAQDLSRIPIQKAEGEEAEKLLDLEKIIHQNFINQNMAVEAVSRHMREYRSGLSEQGGPIASFLFVGPTGVGKTELSKQLAKIQFGSEKTMHRLDMSEYQDKQSVFQLIGTPDGKKRGRLTDIILENPYSLVLLDEIEKAHPDILNLFLQVLDDGRLTDNFGRTVSFKNTIIVATSNAHSEFIKSEIERGVEIFNIAEEIKSKLSEVFKPEFLNRFSDVIVFRSLKIEETEEITAIMIRSLCKQVQKSQGIEITVNKEVIEKIAKLGYSPTFGARPLKKVISEKIRGVLAEKILRKEMGKGNKIEIFCNTNEEFEIKIIG